MTLPFIVEPSELAKHLEDNTVLIVDLSSEANYREAHVPGAIFLPFQALMAGTPPAPGLLPNREQLSYVMTQLGVSADTHVVAYDDEGGGWAARLLWTLDVLGHSQQSYLNGGRHAWLAEDQPISQEIHRAVPLTSPYTVTLDPSPLATLDQVMVSIEQKETQIWDARSPAEYHGDKVLAQKAGHIPGAIHCEWTELMDKDKHWRIRADARAYLSEKGLLGDKPIITHCQSHHRSAFTYLVGKSLGLSIKGYAGSWSEWGNHPDTPVEL